MRHRLATDIISPHARPARKAADEADPGRQAPSRTGQRAAITAVGRPARPRLRGHRIAGNAASAASKSPVFTSTGINALHHVIPDSTMEILDGLSHPAPAQKTPQAVGQHILRFLKPTGEPFAQGSPPAP